MPICAWTSRISLTLAGLGALAILSQRPRYEFVPLATRESAAALAVALAWAAAAWEDRSGDDSLAWLTGRLGLGAFVFLWGHQELVEAISPTTSSLLLIGYYATTSVGFVAWGRARHSAALRRVGLGLGLIAAFLAARGAWKLPEAGTRIAAYLLVSVFLLGIAWWYRQPDDEGARQPQRAD